MGQGIAVHRKGRKVLLSNVRGLSYSRRDIGTLADTYPYFALMVASDYKRLEAEAAAAFNDARNAVYIYDSLVKSLLFGKINPGVWLSSLMVCHD
jgi:hypothetical protein